MSKNLGEPVDEFIERRNWEERQKTFKERLANFNEFLGYHKNILDRLEVVDGQIVAEIRTPKEYQ